MFNTTCPICGSAKDVCTVEDVIYDGTSVSQTQGVSIGMFGSNDFSQMYFSTTTISRLAQLLTPPAKPLAIHWLAIFILSGMGFYLLKEIIAGVSTTPDSGILGVVWFFCLGLITCFIPGVISGITMYLICLMIYAPARSAWKKNTNTLLNSKYCYKDGVVFDEQRKVYSPVDYVDIVFSN